MEEVHKKNKLTQWGSHILMSILMSHIMVTKNPQNVHRKYFWSILLTFIFDVKIDVNICEPHYVNFFLWTSSIVCMFDFLIFDIFLTTWHLFDILTHQFNLNHLSPHRAIFTTRIRRIRKVMFSQVRVRSQGGTPVPGSFPGLWSQVLSWWVTPVPVSFLGPFPRDTPVLPGG